VGAVRPRPDPPEVELAVSVDPDDPELPPPELVVELEPPGFL
jgi:hypothetical protein